MAGGNPSKLVPCTPENARERQLKSAEKRKENNAKKKLMSQIYAEFLEKEYNVRQGDVCFCLRRSFKRLAYPTRL